MIKLAPTAVANVTGHLELAEHLPKDLTCVPSLTPHSSPQVQMTS